MEKKQPAAVPVILVKGLLGSFILTALAILVFSVLLFKTDISEDILHIAVIAVYAVCCFLSGLYCGKKIKERRFLWGLAAGALYYAVLFCASMAVGEGSISVNFATSALVCLGSGMLGGMIS